MKLQADRNWLRIKSQSAKWIEESSLLLKEYWFQKAKMSKNDARRFFDREVEAGRISAKKLTK